MTEALSASDGPPSSSDGPPAAVSAGDGSPPASSTRRRRGRQSRVMVFGSDADATAPEFEVNDDWQIGRRPSGAPPSSTASSSSHAKVVRDDRPAVLVALTSQLEQEIATHKMASTNAKPLHCMPCVARRPAVACSAMTLVVIGLTVVTCFVTTLDNFDVSIDSFSLDTSHFSVQCQDGISAARSEWSDATSTATSAKRRERRTLLQEATALDARLPGTVLSSREAAQHEHSAAVTVGSGAAGGGAERRQLSAQYLLGCVPCRVWLPLPWCSSLPAVPCWWAHVCSVCSGHCSSSLDSLRNRLCVCVASAQGRRACACAVRVFCTRLVRILQRMSSRTAGP